MGESALVAKFAALAAQRLERLQNLVVRLEQGADHASDGREAQRELHTLKGEARILGFDRTARVAHAVEELLHASLAHEALPPDAARRLLLGLDRLGASIAGIARGAEPSVDVDAVVRAIEGGDTPARASFAPAAGSAPERPAAAWDAGAPPAAPALAVDASQLDELTRLLSETRGLHARWRDLTASLRALQERLSGRSSRAVGAGGGPSGGEDEAAELARRAYAEARAQTFENAALIERMDQLTWSLRVLPIDPHLARHPFAVLGLPPALSKLPRLDIYEHGARVEQPVLDALDEIAVHLLRNAVDHGIEPPEERARAGKPEVGRVAIAVRPRGAHVELTIEDDGRGVDLEALRAAAVATRALSPEAAAAASDADMLELLFAPGFTTRQEVSEVSGRGVGLDAALDRARALGGAITVDSSLGRGTTFRAILPARATMARVLLVWAGGARLALPSQVVLGVLGLARSEIETAAGNLFVRVDGEPAPLLDLARAVGEPSRGALPDPLPAVIVAHGRAQRVFFVERVLGARDAVQVPPGRLLEEHPCIRSVAILDDGELALSVDPNALPAVRVPALRLTEDQGAAPASAERASVLVVDDSEVTRDVVGAMLREAGFTVAEAVDGRQALARMGEARPALVITDLQMPVMDGFALMRALREDARYRDLPIVVVSTLGSEADRQQAARAGADAYVVKADLRREALLDVVSRFVRLGPRGAA